MTRSNTLLIGSRSSNDIIFDKPMVSGQHARITREGDAFFIEDLGSTNGTSVNDEPVTRAPIRLGDIIGLGSFSFTLLAEHLHPLLPDTPPSSPPRDATHDEDPAVETTLDAPPTLTEDVTSFQAITLGYHANNTVSIPLPQVSGYHARVTRKQSGYVIVDLNSTNGTFVNDERVHSATPLQLGDRIGFGSYRFTFDASITRHFDDAPTLGATSRHTIAATSAISPISTDAPDDAASSTLEDTPSLTIGRADDNDIIIPAPQVAGHHARIRSDGAGSWLVMDIGSLFGSFVNTRNNALIPHTEHPVSEQDVLFLGSYRFPVSRVRDVIDADGDSQAIQIPEGKELISIGRSKDNDLQLDEPQVSRRHATLRKTDSGWILEDVGSANGTFVNGERITTRLITPRDTIGFGSFIVRLDPNAGVLHKEYQGEIMLRAEDISIDVPDHDSSTKRILHNISFTAYPTEFIGIMGPSGAGKTTLLMALNGYQQPTEGRSLINNQDLYQSYNTFRGNIGYVPQDDIIHRELTVFESLYFTAKLRLPPDTTDEEIEALIDRILKDLGIFETKNVLIGSPLKKGISGGQRKRVNLAQELITQPSLLFLDEPTSGLASSDTQSVMELLRRLADEGRTILLTIHQPSLQVYREMDNVLYLTRGRLVYYGPTYPDSILYFNPDAVPGTPDGDLILSTPDSALAPLAEDNDSNDVDARVEQRTQAFQESQYYKDYVSGRREGQQVRIQKPSKEKISRDFGFRQWWTLTRRTFTIKRKDVANTAILLLQAPIIALLIAAVFNLKQPGDESPFGQFLAYRSQEAIDAAALFMLVASAVWFGCSNSAREIVSELAIYKRERMLNLKIPSYVLSKFSVLAFVCVLQVSMLLGITFPLLGFHAHFFDLFIPILLCSTAGIGIGLLLSALVRSTEAAVALVPLLLIPQLVLGGLIVPLSNMDGGYRTTIRLASNAMISRWAFEGLLHAEDEQAPAPPEIVLPEPTLKLALDFDIRNLNLPDRPNILFVTSKEQRKQLRVWEEKVARVQDQLKARVNLDLTTELNAKQQETSHIESYFGSFASSYNQTNLILLLFNILLIAIVCLILRIKDAGIG